MMDLSQRKEQFSRAYIRAVASVAGFAVATPDPDEDSIDMTLSGRSVNGLPLRPKLDLQLKCTSDDVIRGDQIIYPLKRKNYDELRITQFVAPRLLVVVHVPRSAEEWLRHSEEELVMRRCGYWASLYGMAETTNVSTVTIQILRTNVFDVAGLTGLMERAARRETL
jgi:hypothetical protein